jgi:predicted AAA+ superfamily ATPase
MVMISFVSVKADQPAASAGDNMLNVYSIYNKKLQAIEEEFINECNQSMDALLVFVRDFTL